MLLDGEVEHLSQEGKCARSPKREKGKNDGGNQG